MRGPIQHRGRRHGAAAAAAAFAEPKRVEVMGAAVAGGGLREGGRGAVVLVEEGDDAVEAVVGAWRLGWVWVYVWGVDQRRVSDEPVQQTCVCVCGWVVNVSRMGAYQHAGGMGTTGKGRHAPTTASLPA